MIIGLIRAAVLGFIALSVVFVMVSIYSRSVRREWLEKEWDGDPAREGESTAAREAFIQAGMVQYQGGLRRKLILLIYILPTLAFGVIVYIVNSQ
jgi:hypothetical protein